MTRDNLRKLYTERTAQFRSSEAHQTRIINLIAFLRLITGIGAVWILVLGTRREGLLLYVIAGVLLFFFIFLVTVHQERKDQQNLDKQMRLVNEAERECLDHRFEKLPDGKEYTDRDHPWSYDLDLFGPGSLYQYLNRTATRTGSDRLAGLLTGEPGSAAILVRRQQIIRDLKDRIDFRQRFTARARLVDEKKEDAGEIAGWVSSNVYINRHPWLFYLALLVTAATLVTVVSGIFEPSWFWYLLPLAAFNFTILSFFYSRTNRYHASVSRKHALLEGFARLLEIVSSQQFENPELASRALEAREGTREVAKLSRRLNVFDQRLNMLLGSVFNGLFLFDFIMLYLLEHWKRRNRDKIVQWIELTGWADAAISLAGFAFNHPGFTFPRIGDRNDPLEVQQLGHPLIPDHKRVDNDLTVTGEKVVIITGANMAGKSTFLRALGINTVLAYTGSPVCAAGFSSGLMGLCSSMRTSDSLKDEESYFLAEIRKLQRIVRRMEQGEPLLILLDEVLKGTNTTDKKRGSEGLIRRSIQYPVRVMIATHDLSLAELEKEHPGDVANYCFESYIRDLELHFDYSIRQGVATNMNASFLMKQLGIVD